MATPTHLSPDLIQRLGETLKYTFKDEKLRDKMLEAAGSTPAPGGNRSLAFVGNAVLKLVLSLHGYNQGYDKATINGLQTEITTNSNLAKQASAKGLDVFIRNNPSQGNKIFDNLRATTVEAIIGAVYIDSNYDLSKALDVMIELGLVQG